MDDIFGSFRENFSREFWNALGTEEPSDSDLEKELEKIWKESEPELAELVRERVGVEVDHVNTMLDLFRRTGSNLISYGPDGSFRVSRSFAWSENLRKPYSRARKGIEILEEGGYTDLAKTARAGLPDITFVK